MTTAIQENLDSLLRTLFEAVRASNSLNMDYNENAKVVEQYQIILESIDNLPGLNRSVAEQENEIEELTAKIGHAKEDIKDLEKTLIDADNRCTQELEFILGTISPNVRK